MSSRPVFKIMDEYNISVGQFNENKQRLLSVERIYDVYKHDKLRISFVECNVEDVKAWEGNYAPPSNFR